MALSRWEQSGHALRQSWTFEGVLKWNSMVHGFLLRAAVWRWLKLLLKMRMGPSRTGGNNEAPAHSCEAISGKPQQIPVGIVRHLHTLKTLHPDNIYFLPERCLDRQHPGARTTWIPQGWQPGPFPQPQPGAEQLETLGQLHPWASSTSLGMGMGWGQARTWSHGWDPMASQGHGCGELGTDPAVAS